MKFTFLYRGGSVPKEKMEENGKDWYKWLPEINEKSGFRVAGGTIVSSGGVKPFEEKLGGISIIEVESVEKAQELAKTCPGLKYGGEVVVLEEWKI